MKKFVIVAILSIFIPIAVFANIKNTTKEFTSAMVSQQLFEQAKRNTNWKLAFATAKHAQVVFMNISTDTNPKNEIGMETHQFDQIILVVEGEGKAILDGKSSPVRPGDMIFIPEGTKHNVINKNSTKALKIISFYSDRDVPANAIYQKITDENE